MSLPRDTVACLAGVLLCLSLPSLGAAIVGIVLVMLLVVPSAAVALSLRIPSVRMSFAALLPPCMPESRSGRSIVRLLEAHPVLLRICACATIGFVLAGAHVCLAMQARLPVAMEHREFTLDGEVIALPRHEARRTVFLFRVDDDPRQPAALRGERLRLSWYDDYDAPAGVTADAPRLRIAAGARWRLAAKLRAPRGLRNPGGVDSEKYALVDRIVATGHVRRPSAARALSPPDGIEAWRETMSARIVRAVPSPSSRFVRALALGDTRGLDDRDWDRLRATGLTHLIAISGFHVGLVAGAGAWLARLLWWCLPMLGRRWPRAHAAALAATLAAAGYTAIAGFALPTLRTLLMIAVVALALCLRRGWRPSTALSVSALVLLAIDPLSVLGAGFWLSLGGVAWLLWCLPADDRPPWRAFLSAQVVATTGLLPLTIALFGQASWIGPLANLLAIPWWSLVSTPLSLLGTALEAVHAGAGAWAWRVAAVSFEPSWTLFGWLGATPLAQSWLPEPAWYALPFALFAAFWLLMPRGVPGKPLAVLLWLPLLWPDHAPPGPGEVELVMVDVGQGLSLMVRTSTHTLLFDTGPAMPEGFDAGERAVLPALRASGVRRLDAAVISHGDNDHAGGFATLAGALPVVRRYAPAGSGYEIDSPTVQGGRPQACIAGMQWRWDGVRFRFLHPGPGFPYLRNESSCVLRIESAHGAILLTGDIGDVIERGLLRHDPAAIRAEVVVVAHHGSGGSSDPGFVAATGARLALVSAGYANRFRHPRPGVVDRWRHAGAEVLSTAEGGALRIRLDGARPADAGPLVESERTRHRRLWDAVALRARGMTSMGEAP